MNDIRIGNIADIFDSIQGEGLHAGRYQVFIRLAGCNLDCLYCDTAELNKKSMHLSEVIKRVKELSAPQKAHAAVITGGEPLVYLDETRALSAGLKKAGYRVYLETNGTLPEALGEVIDNLNFIAMDIKLPSGLKSNKELWGEHAEFLKIAARIYSEDKENVFCKVVITAKTSQREIIQAAQLLSDIDGRLALLLQPAADNGGLIEVSGAKLLEYLKSAGDILNKVFIMPQLHKIIGVK